MNADESRSRATPEASTEAISDKRFAEQLRAIERLKQFLFQEKVSVQPDQLAALDFGPLNNLKYAAGGRSPTEDEWRALDKILSGLVPLLTPELRWKLRVRELRFFFVRMPMLALSVAVLATFYYSTYPRLFPTLSKSDWFSNTSYFGSLIVWTISQGVLGACAFLGVTVVTARTARSGPASDPLALAIDITDQSILTIRIILGAMFAFLIGLPLSYRAMDTIFKALFGPDTSAVPLSAQDLESYLFLLAPFMFGFSTSLVLGILNRIVKAMNTLLGISSETQ